MNQTALLNTLSDIAHPLKSTEDLDMLMDEIGDAKIVLLGEASHGTHDYYTWRTKISQRLIQEKDFNFICVEGDWPDCYLLNRFVKNYPDSGDEAVDVVRNFERWPTWMWANWEIVALLEWMKDFNQRNNKNVGFYGLDVYSLWESLNTIMKYLQDTDPLLLQAAEKAYNCFEPYAENVEDYAWATRMVPESCEKEVIELLIAVKQKTHKFDTDPEGAFNAEMNATVLVNAERYYRAMIRSNSLSWNIRDKHMAETLTKLMMHHNEDSKAIVWAHNTHIGDARYTDMADEGMTNLGQIIRERNDEDSVKLIGFGSYKGSVIASKRWGMNMEKMEVPEAIPDSWENLLHNASERESLILTRELADAGFSKTLGHRAIGVVYNPHNERGNYVPTNLTGRYNAFFYLDETNALHPVKAFPGDAIKPPDTYPFGL